MDIRLEIKPNLMFLSRYRVYLENDDYEDTNSSMENSRVLTNDETGLGPSGSSFSVSGKASLPAVNGQLTSGNTSQSFGAKQKQKLETQTKPKECFS